MNNKKQTFMMMGIVTVVAGTLYLRRSVAHMS